MLKYAKIIGLPLSIFVIFILLYGYGRRDTKDKEVVAWVNKDVIYKEDLKKEIAFRPEIDLD
ncbi:MAG: hypothetical protein KAU58_03295 [Candidatus Omnitrophica bacterium]|nr:hypothetical protein [Candidatus Omnitrophota bacterium]